MMTKHVQPGLHRSLRLHQASAKPCACGQAADGGCHHGAEWQGLTKACQRDPLLMRCDGGATVCTRGKKWGIRQKKGEEMVYIYLSIYRYSIYLCIYLSRWSVRQLDGLKERKRREILWCLQGVLILLIYLFTNVFFKAVTTKGLKKGGEAPFNVCSPWWTQSRSSWNSALPPKENRAGSRSGNINPQEIF